MKPVKRSRPKPNKRRPQRQNTSQESDGKIRLQKVLASAGIGSRRQCEELITTGRVEVDGATVTELGTKVDPSQQEVRVDGTPLPKPKLLYYAVNKPTGVVSTNRDPAGRPRVIDLVPVEERLFAVGRLDLSSEGLILVTNDGELANLLAHPRYGVEKVYHVLIAGVPEPEVLEKLRHGVHLAEGFAHVTRVSIKSQQKSSTLLEMVLDEGRNREIRRLLASLGHKALKLKRIAMGTLRLGELAPGDYRVVRREEVRSLKQLALGGGKTAASAEGHAAAPVARSMGATGSMGASGSVTATVIRKGQGGEGRSSSRTQGVGAGRKHSMGARAAAHKTSRQKLASAGGAERAMKKAAAGPRQAGQGTGPKRPSGPRGIGGVGSRPSGTGMRSGTVLKPADGGSKSAAARPGGRGARPGGPTRPAGAKPRPAGQGGRPGGGGSRSTASGPRPSGHGRPAGRGRPNKGGRPGGAGERSGR